jgi:4-amino-4-deoxy-L-arabinose transferase-like glycosyltransferase
VVGTLVLFALGLRLWHLTEGLPDFFEEAFPFRRAFEMAGWERGRVDWNPHAFHYPSLSFYLHMAAQAAHYQIGRLFGVFGGPADYFVATQADPTTTVVIARMLGVTADLATLLAVVRIGERARRGAGWLAGLLVALSATLVHQSRTIVTDGLMTALAAWCLERLLAYRAGSGRWALAGAAALAGLAAGVKYPAALLALPLAWAVVAREREKAPWPLALALAGALSVFALTSPFLMGELARARFDLLRIASQVGEGQLGTFGRPSYLYYLRVFARDFGWAALPLLAATLAWLGWRSRAAHDPPSAAGATGPTRLPGLAIVPGLWWFLLAFAVPMLMGRVEFERYLVPVTPAAALLLSLAALAFPDALPRLDARAREVTRAALVLMVAVPAAWAGFEAASVGADTTQAQARRFLEARLGPDDLLVTEAHGAGLRDRWEALQVVSGQAFARADTSWRRRYLERPVLRAVRLPLLVAGRAVVVAPAPGGGTREIELFESSADLNRVFYEPSLYRGVDWVLTSSAVRGRYEADPARFARQVAFYRLLEQAAEPAEAFRSGGAVTGPEIRIYRWTERTREALERAGALDPLWWTRDVPDSARRELEAAMTGLGSPAGATEVPRWVLALGAVFDRQVEPFVYRLALELAETGRCAESVPIADAILTLAPGHVQAAGLRVTCAEALGDAPTARAVIERLLAIRDPDGTELPDIRLEYARLLAQTGARDEARRELERVLSAPLSTGEIQRRAREMMQRLGSASSP